MTATGKAAGSRPAAGTGNGAGNGKAKSTPEVEKATAGRQGRAAAAAAEVEEAKPKVIKFGDLRLELPAELPPQMLFDLTLAQVNSDNPMPGFMLLHSLLGEEQFIRVRNEVARRGTLEGADEILNEALEQYGMSLGESSASQDS